MANFDPARSALADQAITADRSELTYLVSEQQRKGLVEYFDGSLPMHDCRAEPRPQRFVTTVYFDTPTRLLLRAARADRHDNVKLRAKSYHDVLPPAQPPLWTDPPGELWLELKQRSGVRTKKFRIRLNNSALLRWLSERGELMPVGYLGREADAQVLQRFVHGELDVLEPSSVASYERSSWQSEDGELRITLDSELAFYLPAAGLLHQPSLRRETLGVPCKRETRAILEVKHRGESLPRALAARLLSLGLTPSDYSKFVSSGTAVETSLAALSPPQEHAVDSIAVDVEEGGA
jgi:hypothetical protein